MKKKQSSQLHQSQRDESREVELLSSNSTEHRTLKVEAHGDDCGESEPARDLGRCSHLQHTDDVQQLHPIKEEILPEQQEWNLSVDQADVKEEQDKLWITQQRQQLYQLEEANTTLAVVSVKSENDEKPQSSQAHHSQSDESTDAVPVACNSTILRILTEEAVGEDDGRPQPASNSGPYSCLKPNSNGRSSKSSTIDTDNSQDWKQTRDFSSGFNCLKNSNVSVSSRSSKIAKKQFNCSRYGNACGHMQDSKQIKGRQASEKPFPCPNQAKRQKGTLGGEILIHTGKKIFGCSECGKRFGEKSTLIRHMRIHIGEKPFGCFECGQRFRCKDSLNKHMRIHTGEKPFSCSQCGQRFRQKGTLIRHTRIHIGDKPFGCFECDQRFRHKNSLTTHMTIHTGQKQFDCLECGKRFRQKGTLIRHMISHTGQKQFGCSECGKRFGLKCNLIRHMRIHTKE
ncbi:zinc finger protein OZF-like [Thalassophryne amazonica]|uniref:zinc finger protein OZF-like n=1 Tax=Thalassophryne amazonica TaxID=390379 RepID=UPI0014721C98|nr:zinc finger protein OZF-like [Thalassophryne amazonica]